MEVWQEDRALCAKTQEVQEDSVFWEKSLELKGQGWESLMRLGREAGTTGRGHLVKEVLSGRRLRFRFYSCLSRALSVPDLTCRWASSMQLAVTLFPWVVTAPFMMICRVPPVCHVL